MQLLEHHQERADAIRLTLNLLHESERKTKKATVSQHLAAAIGLDKARVAKRGRPPKKAAAAKHQSAAMIKKHRHATAAFLKQFTPTRPIPNKGVKYSPTASGALGTLKRHGYLKQTGDGWVRTDKQFTA